MTIYGYTRVSTSEQNPEMQVLALKAAGAQVFFQDVGSGKNVVRPNLNALIQNVQEGDTVMVWKLDRLGRSLVGVFDIVNQLTKKKVGLKSLTEKVIDTTNPDDHIANAMFGMLAVFGQLERDLIRERIREGVAIAKANGRMKGGGRPKRLGILDEKHLISEAITPGITVTSICKKFRISKRTYYRIMDKHEYKAISK